MRPAFFAIPSVGGAVLSGCRALHCLCYAPGVKDSIAIVGAGRLGTALKKRLTEAGYRVSTIRSRRSRMRKNSSRILWLCVPDSKITGAAQDYARLECKEKVAFHSSGVLTSEALDALKRAGASVASVHPLMTFVADVTPDLNEVPFAIEGDDAAVRAARRIVRDLGGRPVGIQKAEKVAYHAFATMICPLLIALLAAAEKIATLAGISEPEARRRMLPIIQQTLRNYQKLGPAGAFSGPIIRGDVDTVRTHLNALAQVPAAKDAYIALAKAALEFLPTGNRREIMRTLNAATANHSANKSPQ
jgi:predicted short-subunit dehydrogenase-like oxidoreductase (DUF2520 family)